MKVYLEGPDLIGKTTLCKYVNNIIPTIDRHHEFTQLVNIDGSLKDFKDLQKLYINLTNEEYIIVLYSETGKLLTDRLIFKKDADDFDKQCLLYNESYKKLIKMVIDNKLNDHIIPICIDERTVFEQIKEIVRSVVLRNMSNFDPNPIITGESKLFYKINNMPTLALVELKPTLYSFTHNRYGNVDGTDNLRNDFWNLFSSKLNNSMINFQLENINFVSKNLNCLAQKWVDMSDYTLISDHLGFIAHKSKIYNLVIFDKAIPNIEVVWKQYLYGTMKHTLDTVDKYPVRNRPETKIQYEGILPKSITRFDWRNPLPGKDECIPEDFADFYIDVKNAKLTCEITSLLLNSMLIESGFYLIDLCYFMNEVGTQIKSEITPDGMRIKNFKNESFDKDLWRHGSANETIVDTWIKLLAELEKNKDTVISGLLHKFDK